MPPSRAWHRALIQMAGSYCFILVTTGYDLSHESQMTSVCYFVTSPAQATNQSIIINQSIPHPEFYDLLTHSVFSVTTLVNYSYAQHAPSHFWLRRIEFEFSWVAACCSLPYGCFFSMDVPTHTRTIRRNKAWWFTARPEILSLYFAFQSNYETFDKSILLTD